METERLILRPWKERDAAVLFKWASDPEVGPRAGWSPHKSVEESLKVIREVFSAEGMWGDYFPENPASGKVMEKCGFINTGKEVFCPNLEVGGDKPVRVLRLDYAL